GIGADEPAGGVGTARLHIALGNGRQNRAGVVADQAAHLQIRNVGTSDVSARGGAGNQALIDTGEPTECGASILTVDAAGAARAGDAAAGERVLDDAEVEADEPAADAIRADADIGRRAGVLDEAFVLCGQAARRTRLRSAADGAAEDLNIADRAAVLAGERRDEYEVAGARDLDLAQIEISPRRATLHERQY